MWFSLFSVVLILCIAFFQALQGLFSAVIMCVLTILSAALAFGVYENLYYGLLMAQLPEQGEAVALVGAFLVALLILRTLADNVVKGNMQFPVWVDRIGGGAFGLVAAILVVGMIQIGFELLPFDATFLGFNRFVPVSADRNAELTEQDLKKKGPDAVRWRRESLTFSPDEFTIKLVALLSDGALSGTTSFREVHPDFAAEIQNSRSAVQRESRHVAGAVDAITVDTKGYWILPPGRLMRPVVTTDKAGNDKFGEKAAELPNGLEWRVYHVFLDEPARDSDSRIRFKPNQVRIVGRDRPGGPPAEYILKGIERESDPSQFMELFRDPVLGKPEWSDVVRNPKGKTPFDFVFEVPKTFQAAFIEFKRTARADVSMVREKPEKELAEPSAPKARPKGPKPPTITEPPGLTNPPEAGTAPPTGEAPDRISGVWLSKAPVYAERMPLKLSSQTAGLELENGKVAGGHCAVPVTPENLPKSDADRLPFAIPEGRRLLFVPLQELDPQSFLGQARGFAQRALPTITLKLADGKEIKPVGKYAFAKIGGQWWFEMTYLNETARDADRDIPIFDKIHHADLTQPSSVYVYLFLVPSGSKATALARAKAEPIDLEPFNLVAPP